MLSLSPTPYWPSLQVITRATRERADVSTLAFHVPDSPRFKPGQFNMLYAVGVGEIAVSISGDPSCAAERMHTIRSVGAISHALTELREGDVLGVRGPFGTAWPLGELVHRDLILIAGGLGIAALRSAVLFVLSRRAEYGAITVLYGARTSDGFVFRRDLEAWRSATDVRVELTVDTPKADWHGAVGSISDRLADLVPSSNSAALLCGPEPMMKACACALQAKGVSASSIWLSLERSMKCGIGLCGHCQLGPRLLCRDGPIDRFDRLAPLLAVPEF